MCSGEGHRSGSGITAIFSPVFRPTTDGRVSSRGFDRREGDERTVSSDSPAIDGDSSISSRRGLKGFGSA